MGEEEEARRAAERHAEAEARAEEAEGLAADLQVRGVGVQRRKGHFGLCCHELLNVNKHTGRCS